MKEKLKHNTVSNGMFLPDKTEKIRMKKVITYGTFDLFHQGHINLLRRAKSLGDYLIVGVTTDNYDRGRGKLNVHRSLMERIEDVQNAGLADEIIIEEYEGQKIDDILRYGVDIFAIGSDWLGKFDYLQEFCQVVYLERTKGVSSTQLRIEAQSVTDLGIIGSGRIAGRFVPESKFVSGIEVKGVFNTNIDSAKSFCQKYELSFYTDDFDEFISKVNAVYITSPHLTHYDYIKSCLMSGKHVLCEKPLALTVSEVKEMYQLAENKGLVLKEAIKTAYCPAFSHLITVVKSGVIGNIKDIDVSFTKLCSGNIRELDAGQAGGSVTELASYVLLPIFKILGYDYHDIQFYSHVVNEVDVFTRGLMIYDKAIASFKVGLGVKSEGDLIISGTKGYAYVPAPWWKTEYFELRYEDQNQTRKYFYKFDGEGLRYEINDFLIEMNKPNQKQFKFQASDSVAIASIIEKFRNNENVHRIH